MHSYSFLPPAITSITILIFSLLIGKKISHSVQYRALLILCLNTIWWHLSWVFLFLTQNERVAQILAKVGHIGILALPLTFHYFYVTLGGQRSKLIITKICIYSFFLACLGFTDWIIQGVNLFAWGFYPKAGILHPVFLLFATYFLISGLVLNYKNMKETTSLLKRKTLQLCQSAGAIYSFGAVDFLVNYKLSEFYPFGFLFSITFIVIVSYAVIKFDLFSKEEKLLKALHVAQLAQRDSEVRLGQLATQVAHDLRSPLAVLKAALFDFGNYSVEHQMLLKGSIDRIQEIVNELLKEAKAARIISDQSSSTQINKLSQPIQREDDLIVGDSTPLSVFIQNIVTESRFQHRSRSDLRIVFELNDENRTIVAVVQASEFKRILSNLINNSIEAIEGSGQIFISLSRDITPGNKPASILLCISDNGKGIPRDILSKLGAKGVTFGKRDGNGLGVYHAISTVRKWGGNLEIKSVVGVGTQVMLSLRSSPLEQRT
jgi:two-component system CAI-1 autoinducer sensor kinase/phosphatase CqsS